MMKRSNLEAMLNPKRIAVVGATNAEGSVGRGLMLNVIAGGFSGELYAVNPGRTSLFGKPCVAKVSEIPGKVDLVLIAVPARSVPDVVADCAKAGAGGAIIVSAGFRETGEAGVELESAILQTSRRSGMRIIGPNCLGVMFPHRGLNGSFAHVRADPGRIAFVSQSGALCSAVLDWSRSERVGFSAFISVGSMLDVGWGELIDHLGDDPHTSAILLYMESVGDARSFLSAARQVALSKPIIVIKPGRTEAAARAAASHTGSLVGTDAVLDAAFRRAGVLRVDRLADLFYMAETLSRQPRPRGNRLTILTNAGGPGVLAADALMEGGGVLASVSERAIRLIDPHAPGHWSRSNPLDLLGDAGAERFSRALEALDDETESDGLLVILSPQDATQSTETAERLARYARDQRASSEAGREFVGPPRMGGRPILASWMGGSEIEVGERMLNDAGVPTFRYPDTAARVFNDMHRHARSIAELYETPEPEEGVELDPAAPESAASHRKAAALLGPIIASGRTLLSERESKSLLLAYGIPVEATHSASTSDEAIAIARAVGFPVVVKLDTNTITHKSAVGGVRLDVRDADQVREAFDLIKSRVPAKDFLGVTVQSYRSPEMSVELIVGSALDEQFGPVLMMGAGGVHVEWIADTALALPPLNATLAERWLEQTRVGRAMLDGVLRERVDIDVLKRVLVRFSRLVSEQRRVRGLEVNPLRVDRSGVVALDARIELHRHDLSDDDLPRLAIRPYPSQYVGRVTTSKGLDILLRPIRPEDEPLLVAFHAQLSEETVRFRWFHSMQFSQRTSHERLRRVCFADYDRELAMVAESGIGGTRRVVGVGRLSRTENSAEYAVVVSDAEQGKGIGRAIMTRLIEVARAEGIRSIYADVLPDNHAMQGLCRQLGFKLDQDFQEQIVKARLTL